MKKAKFIGDVTRFKLVTPSFILYLDKPVLVSEIMKTSSNKVSPMPIHSFYEDNWVEGAEIQKLLDLVIECGTSYFGKQLQHDTYWGHIQRPLESTEMHSHVGSDISWCYYADAPEDSGTLVFSIVDNFSVDAVVDPIEGVLIFFPSWVRHRVTKNLSDNARVSVAGNLRFL